MKGSYYSNMGTSKVSARSIEDTCLQHQGQPYTNFCVAMTCIKPLCPQCIQSHYGHHRNIRTPPQIHSFKTLKNKCVGKIADILQQVGSEQMQGALSQLHSIFQSSIQRVKETRQQCRKILDAYFNNLEDFIKKKMSKMTSEQSDIISEMDRVSNIVAQLKLLLNKLQNNKYFLNSASTIIKLDGDKLEQKVREGYANISRFKQGQKNNLFIDKSFEHRLTNFLSNTFYYGNKDNLENMPKIADQMRTKTAMDNLSRSQSRGKQDFIEESKVSKRQPYQNDNSYYRRQDNTQFRKEDSSFYRKQDNSRKDDDDKRSNASRRSSKKGLKAPKKDVIGMNTFSNNSPRRYLHFFQHDQNILHYLDLDQGADFTAIPLAGNTRITDFHKSIAVSTGDLFLIGGAQSDSPDRKSPNIFRFQFDSRSLTLMNKLKYGRSSHSICFNNRYIYVLGGYLDGQMLTNRCQRYDIVSNRVQQVRPMNYPACSFACCSFGGRYIYKFGGVGQNNEIIHYIERFDQKTGIWEEVNPVLDLPQGETLVTLSSSAAVQITRQQIMVMGGYDQANNGYRQTYILRVEDNLSTSIREVNVYPLPAAQGFWNSNPIVHKKIVFALQNVSTGQNDCSQSVRRILSFDGGSWKEL